MSQYKFHAEIREAPRGGAWVEIPSDVLEAFGTRGRVKVKASFDGYPYRGSIVPMGGVHVLGVKKATRAAIGKSVGDTVHVILEQDAEPREVDVPEELAKALEANPEASAFFDTLAYTYRKEYAEWIAGAKRAETREQRAQRAVEKLGLGEKLRQ
jgi:hypothetical protein